MNTADPSDLPAVLKGIELSSVPLLNKIRAKAGEMLLGTPKSICRTLYMACYSDKAPDKTLFSELSMCACVKISAEVRSF
jgi:hypothetical protein